MITKRIKKFLAVLFLLVFAIGSTAIVASNAGMLKVSAIVNKKFSYSMPFSGFVDNKISDKAMLQKFKTTNQSKFENTIMSVDLAYPNKELNHDDEIDIDAYVEWENEQKPLKADLKGSALVYAKDGSKILLGSLFGYNGEESEQNYVAMTFTLDVEGKTGIATITIGTDDGNGNRPVTIQFGTNSSKYKEAIQFLGDKSNETRSNSRDVDNSTEDTPLSPAVDTGIYERQTVTSDYGYGNFVFGKIKVQHSGR